MFFLVSYNIDKFKKFIFESSFLDRYKIADETVEKIREDEIARLEFGINWLKSLLFKGASEDQFKINKKPEGIRKKS